MENLSVNSSGSKMRLRKLCNTPGATGCLLLLLTSQSYAQQCNLNRKEIVAGVTLCSSTNCISTSETLRIFGRNLLHYDPSQAGGVSYVLGQTVGLSKTQLGKFAPDGGDPSGRAQASYIDDTIRLRLEIDITHQSRRVTALILSIIVKLVGCSTCRVVDFTVSDPSGPQWTLSRTSSCDLVAF